MNLILKYSGGVSKNVWESKPADWDWYTRDYPRNGKLEAHFSWIQINLFDDDVYSNLQICRDIKIKYRFCWPSNVIMIYPF